MKKHLKNSKKNQLKAERPIIGEVDGKETFLLTPKWLEGWEKEEEQEPFPIAPLLLTVGFFGLLTFLIAKRPFG